MARTHRASGWSARTPKESHGLGTPEVDDGRGNRRVGQERPDWSEDRNSGDAVLVIPPKKKAISIRVDEDVLDFFRHEGAGYQRRMNAVLRSYMQQKKGKKTKKRV
jgi:uncharacterized protein (DUF4415 family)